MPSKHLWRTFGATPDCTGTSEQALTLMFFIAMQVWTPINNK